MTLIDLKEIKKEVDSLAQIIKVPDEHLPTYDYSKDFGYPHVEVDKKGYHYVVVERGEELERKSTNDLKELLYWIFDHATFSMAIKYELDNRIEDKDSRRISFKKQEELLAILNPSWCDRKKLEHKEILKKHPFDDLAGLRASYCRELREKGFSEEEIDKMAYDKYPE